MDLVLNNNQNLLILDSLPAGELRGLEMAWDGASGTRKERFSVRVGRFDRRGEEREREGAAIFIYKSQDVKFGDYSHDSNPRQIQ
jgi:hypothetical protein